VRQEGVRLSEKFFAAGDWRADLAEKKLSVTLTAIVEAFRPCVEELKAAEEELLGQLGQLSDERTRLLETVPSIGVLTARTVVSALDEARRFDNRKCVARYGALTPTIYQSGDVLQHGRVNRDGRLELRRVMLECAHTVTRMKSPAARPLREFCERLEKKRGKKRALVALARKLLVVCYGVLKSGKPYDPSKLDKRGPTPTSPNPSPSTNGKSKLYVLKRAA
jgi:transposase